MKKTPEIKKRKNIVRKGICIKEDIGAINTSADIQDHIQFQVNTP